MASIILRYIDQLLDRPKRGAAVISLGDICRDKVTSFKGVAVARHEYITGCVRFSLQPASTDDGKLLPFETFDEGQLEVIGSINMVAVSTPVGGSSIVPPKGGPQEEPKRPSVPTR